MKRNLIQMACLAGLIAACSPKQSVVSVPPSQIDVEQLRDSIDYAMDVSVRYATPLLPSEDSPSRTPTSVTSS